MGEDGNDHGKGGETEGDDVKDENVGEVFGDCFGNIESRGAENSVWILMSSQSVGSFTFLVHSLNSYPTVGPVQFVSPFNATQNPRVPNFIVPS